MIGALFDAVARLENVPKQVLDASSAALEQCEPAWRRRDATAARISATVARAFAGAALTDAHLSGTTGYGYHDFGRAAYEALIAALMGCEASIARPQLASGTQAIIATLAALAQPGEAICSITGPPYDTLRMALVDHPRSLASLGVRYEETPWAPGDALDEGSLSAALRRKPAVAFIQRSRGYAPRASATIADIERLVRIVRRESAQTAIVVDNCYGEFVEDCEPGAIGADAVIGSLIKNPGGGMAVTGAYVAGTARAVEHVAERIFAPGLGTHVGPTLEVQRLAFAGLHRAPRTVAESLKILDFAAALFSRLGYAVDPTPGSMRTDIIQAIRLGTREKLIAFACGLQRMLPVNAHARPEPGPVPGYADPVIMAGGAFISGSTMELSCDAPLRPPFEVYLQGGMDCAHGVLAVAAAAAAVAGA